MSPFTTYLPHRERLLLAIMLIVISLLAWSYLAHHSAGMPGMESASGVTTPAAHLTTPRMEPWQVDEVAFTFLMWAVMMVAMMTPSAAPMILAYAGIHRLRTSTLASRRALPAFVAGYLMVWIAFSAGATLLQWGFHSAGLLLSGTASATPLVAGSLLILAGAYQFTRWKQVCLSRCRSPIDFLMTEWREGTRGALIMGTRHGAYCVGCCWALMLLLFVAGVMNLVWVAILAGYVLLEKVVPGGRPASRLAGLLAIGWGAWLCARVLVL